MLQGRSRLVEIADLNRNRASHPRKLQSRIGKRELWGQNLQRTIEPFESEQCARQIGRDPGIERSVRMGEFEMSDRALCLAEVEPRHAEERIDRNRVASVGERPFGNRAGFLEASRPRSVQRVVNVRWRRSCLRSHDVLT
jgi:hypothetical protein